MINGLSTSALLNCTLIYFDTGRHAARREIKADAGARKRIFDRVRT
jgi:hypothetical protein